MLFKKKNALIAYAIRRFFKMFFMPPRHNSRQYASPLPPFCHTQYALSPIVCCSFSVRIPSIYSLLPSPSSLLPCLLPHSRKKCEKVIVKTKLCAIITQQGTHHFAKFSWGYGSVGRASRSQCEGQGFESPYLHQSEYKLNPSTCILFLCFWGKIKVSRCNKKAR